ncbi:hypothetical protein C495_01365 [Natronorubrum sulfidifaciens JCM 14089]|uniref:Uncharacterized protein n=1 Tax=Natronorubrum sulfidifaciens JCM 14089 TaxID=1230460 RepID=L9WFN8_9EURY|nr:hypothetical protein C495_01365 [Natronorubrum sulfidifaciens JCM 14089]
MPAGALESEPTLPRHPLFADCSEVVGSLRSVHGALRSSRQRWSARALDHVKNAAKNSALTPSPYAVVAIDVIATVSSRR